MGRGRSGQNPSPVATLFPEHARPDIRRRLQRSGTYQRGARRAHANVGRGRATRSRPTHLCKQTGTILSLASARSLHFGIPWYR